MNKIVLPAILLIGFLAKSQDQNTDTIKTEQIKEVILIAKKPTIESKADRTVFNVANSSILSGNTTWDVLRMTPLVNIDNNDVVKAEGENVTVYINDRKSVFTGKELKEYLKTIPADNLMKIEVITSPSARYEANGSVINIVLKKLLNEGMKGSASFTNTQNRKNSQYSNLNLNYHKGNYTQSLMVSYSDNINVYENKSENFLYANNSLTKISNENTHQYKTPSFSSTSELELNDKNNIGLILEFSRNQKNSSSNANGETYENGIFQDSYARNQFLEGRDKNLGTNVFYKYYDKEKNKILDINLGVNYDAVNDTNTHLTDFTNAQDLGIRILANNQNRDYYFKADYSQPIGKEGSQIEFGGKINFKNNVVPYTFLNFDNNQWMNDPTRTNNFQYLENLNAVYGNYSHTLFKKLETRVGLRYEYIHFIIQQHVGNIEKKNSYGSLMPNLLLKYSFSDNYNLTATYNRYLWRPWYSEFNPFLLPSNDGTYFRGNMDLQPNPSNRINLKLGLFKNYFISANYFFTNQDYWSSWYLEDGKMISMPTNFDGKVKNYRLNASTNQTFLENKFNVNFDFGFSYSDNSDFNAKNNIQMDSYVSNWNGSSNISYTNLFNKNINLSGWFGIFTQNNGNSLANRANFFHNISMTKIFPNLEMEATIRLNNIFMRPHFDNTTYSSIGTFRNSTIWDWHGISFSLVKRFGNQKVKENSKTNVEKDSGGGK